MGLFVYRVLKQKKSEVLQVGWGGSTRNEECHKLGGIQLPTTTYQAYYILIASKYLSFLEQLS